MFVVTKKTNPDGDREVCAIFPKKSQAIGWLGSRTKRDLIQRRHCRTIYCIEELEVLIDRSKQ